MVNTDTIAAIATAMGNSGIGIVRISGEEAIEIADRVFKFKGGKGVSTGAGVALALAPLPLLCALAFWVVLFLTTRYVSVASIAAAVGLPVFAFAFRFFNIGNVTAKSLPVLIFFCAIAAITVYRHRSNIKRLLEGTENRFEKKH